jgi:hypothetical protein
MGGYHSEGDCHDTYGKYLASARKDWHDVQLVRKASVTEVREYLEFMDPHHKIASNHQIEMIIGALAALTPEGDDKKAWKDLHNK